MPMMDMLLAELEVESAATRRLLERVPFDDPEFKPHEKSMTLQRLAGHLAEIPRWAQPILAEDELDFAAGNYEPFNPDQHARAARQTRRGGRRVPQDRRRRSTTHGCRRTGRCATATGC